MTQPPQSSESALSFILPDSMPPLPQPTEITRPFWQASRQNRLCLQCCSACQRYRFYPTATCPHCASQDHAWHDVDKNGSVYSWIVVHHAIDAIWQPYVPFTVVVGALPLPGRPLLPGILVPSPDSDLTDGSAIKLGFEIVSETLSLPRWRLCAAAPHKRQETP